MEETETGEYPVDVYQKLSEDRILFLCNNLTDNIATDLISTLLLKDNENNEKITLFINSMGGDIRNALMIHDMIQMLGSPLETVCIGSAMNEAVILLAAGTPGMRYVTKNSIISVSQIVNEWAAHANLTDAKKILDLTVKDNKRMMSILAECTGKTLKTINSDFERKVYMSPNQAVKYGLVDKVVKISKGK